MATVNSAVDVCNMALAFIGTDRISALSEDTKQGNLCSLYYSIERDAEIQKHDWSFATFRQSLASPSETNYTDYSYQYQLPEDPFCLRVLKIDQAPTADWKVEGRKLYTNEDEVELVFIGQVENPRLFPPLFATLLSYRLAMRLASAFSGKDSKVVQLEQLYRSMELEAQGMDSVGMRSSISSSDWWHEVNWT